MLLETRRDAATQHALAEEAAERATKLEASLRLSQQQKAEVEARAASQLSEVVSSHLLELQQLRSDKQQELEALRTELGTQSSTAQLDARLAEAERARQDVDDRLDAEICRIDEQREAMTARLRSFEGEAHPHHHPNRHPNHRPNRHHNHRPNHHPNHHPSHHPNHHPTLTTLPSRTDRGCSAIACDRRH